MSLKSRRQPVVSLYPSVHRQHGGPGSVFSFSHVAESRDSFLPGASALVKSREAAFFILAPASYGFKCKFRVCRTRSASVDHSRILLGSDLRKNSADGRPDRMIRMVAWARSCKWILVAITRCVLERRVMTIALNNEHSHLSSALQYKRYAIPSIIFMRLSLS